MVKNPTIRRTDERCETVGKVQFGVGRADFVQF